MPDTLEQILGQNMIFDGFNRAQIAIVVTNPFLEDNPIVYVNEAFTRCTGYARSASIGRNCRFLQGPETSKVDVDKLRRGIENEETTTVDIINYRANGEKYLNRLVVSPLCDNTGKLQYFIGIQKELRETDTDAGTEQMNAALMEIQNRVATDLSIVIGMIRQQSGSTSVPEDFVALSRRIETLQLLYEEMKLSDRQSNRNHVEMGSYLSRLSAAIAHVTGRSGIRLTIQIEPLEVPIETATRVGLVLSELLTNAFQHAFDRLDNGLVEVRMSRLSAGGLRLIVSDDGVGIPNTMVWPDPSTVGGRIVSGLIEGLEGTLHLGRGAAGSFVTIDVPAGATLVDE
ncbi:PAS domain-containing protein [uncultured Tateyamaria sp.]|uniref:PAS domain-containing protein n=1 Tax=uncultured Tateyamaria sp. TaxID=455651 RepID=UPI002633B41D|nr:PAS domain-containing protein [uncultured Tateyamaria sp.]